MSKSKKATTPKQKKNVGYRLLSILILLACVGVLFVPISTFDGIWSVEKKTIIQTVQDLIASGTKKFGFLPVLVNGNGILTLATNAAFYVMLITLLIAAILALFAIFSKKKTPSLLRTAVSFLTWGAATYALALVCITCFRSNGYEIKFDLYTTVIACVFAFFYFLLMFIKLGKAAWINAFEFLLTLGATALLFLAMTLEGEELLGEALANKETYKWILVGILAVVSLNLIIETFHAMFKEGLPGELVRYSIQLLCALAACYVGYAAKINAGDYLLYCVIAAAVAALQIILVTVQLVNRGKKLAAEAAEAAIADFETEEYVEAYAYEGGPVAGVEIAEEVNPTEASTTADGKPNLASLVGNGFDAFMFTLNETEKEEFIDLYILRCKVNMPEIPAYVVGGDNKEFFNKVFIYLGQYREKISSGLLAKMYKFSMKLS